MATQNESTGGSKSASNSMVPLPNDFQPSGADVLCGRGKKNYNSVGNQKLNRIVESYVPTYSAASSRQDKSNILSAIVNEIRKDSPNGGFVKQDPVTNQWFEVGDFLAREKVSQAFRDALAFQYRSSKKFKHEKRRQRDQASKFVQEMESQKKVAKKTRNSVQNVLVNRESLAVMREEPMMGSTYIQPGQMSQPPSELRQRLYSPHGAPFLQHQQSYPTEMAFYSEQQLQQQHQLQFNERGFPMHDTTMGMRHTSRPQLQLPNTHMYNPIHSQELMISRQQLQLQQHPQQQSHQQPQLSRRYSDAAMIQDMAASQRRYTHPIMAPEFEEFHHSMPNLPTWTHTAMDQGHFPMQQQLPIPPHAAASLRTNANPFSVVPQIGSNSSAHRDSAAASSILAPNIKTAIIPGHSQDHDDPFEPMPLPPANDGQQEQHEDEQVEDEHEHESFPDW